MSIIPQKKILIVDDEVNMRLVLKAMLKKEGYDVETAADGLEALALLRRHDITACVTDLRMPGIDEPSSAYMRIRATGKEEIGKSLSILRKVGAEKDLLVIEPIEAEKI